MIGAWIITSFLTWANTSPIVFAKTNLSQDFQIRISKPKTTVWSTYPSYSSAYVGEPRAFNYSVWSTYSFLLDDPLIEKVEPVYKTISLFNTEEKSESSVWYQNPEIILGTVYLSSDLFLDNVEEEFGYNGEFSVGQDGVLLSKKLASQLSNASIPVEIGSRINLAVATRIPHIDDLDERELSSWQRVFFTDLVVKGIYEWHLQSSITGFALDSLNLNENSMFMSYSLLNDDLRELLEGESLEQRPGPITLFVQLNPDESVNRGITNLAEEINRLSRRVSYSCDGEIDFGYDVKRLSDFVEYFEQSRTLLIYLLPAIGISVCVTILNAEIVFEGRRREVGILRARGALSRQIFSVFILEFLVLALIGTILGFSLGIPTGCLIQATRGIFDYDMNIFQTFFDNIAFSPYVIPLAFLICGVIPLAYAIGEVRSYIKTEDINTYRSERGDTRTKGFFAHLFLLFLMLFAFFLISQAIDWLSTVFGGFVLYIFLIPHWFLLVYVIASIVTRALPRLSKSMLFLPGTKRRLIALDFRRRRIFIPLMTLLILTFSILTFSLVEAETTRENITNQVRYAIGCDIRIHTSNAQQLTFIQNLTQKFPAITEVMPVLYKDGFLGRQQYVKVLGIDVSKYMEISPWSLASTSDTSYQEALNLLGKNPYGVIISESLSELLQIKIHEEIRIMRITSYRPFIMEPWNLEVVGTIKTAPGFGVAAPLRQSGQTNLGFQEDNAFAFVDEELLLQDGVNSTDIFFASADREKLNEDTIGAISEIPEVRIAYSPLTFDLSQVSVYLDLYMQSVRGILTLQFLVTIIVGIIVLLIFSQYVHSKKQIEYAVMRAVGATKKDLVSLVFSESSVTVFLSLITGTLLGLVYSIVLFDLSLQIFPLASIIPYLINIPVFSLAVSFAIVISIMLVSNYLQARISGKTEVSRTLRNL